MVGLVTRSAYEFDHHWNAALQAGVKREQLESLAQFETSPHFDDQERAVLRYAREATETGVVSDATWERAAAPFRHAAGDGSRADGCVVQLRGAHPAAARDRARARLQAQLIKTAQRRRNRGGKHGRRRRKPGRGTRDRGRRNPDREGCDRPADRRPLRVLQRLPSEPCRANSRRSSRSRPTARIPTSRSTSSATGISCCAIIPTWCRASPRASISPGRCPTRSAGCRPATRSWWSMRAAPASRPATTS